MSRKPIPERAPVTDSFTGYVLQVGQSQVLSLASQADVDVLGSGNLVICYGVRYLGKPHLSIVPGLVALDLAQPVDVFVYANETSIVPYAQPTALIAPADAEISPRLQQYLPRFDTLAEWQDHD